MRLDRQASFSGTAEADLRPTPLAAYLESALPGFRGPLNISRFKGGQSNPTYLLETPSARYVLRRRPSGTLLPSAHAIDREYRVTRALAGAGFPVARPIAICLNDTVIGSAFYVMEHVEGRVFWEPWAPGLAASDRHGLFDSLNRTIAGLHSFDYEAAGLADFGRPQGYMARQVRRWSEQYRASRTEDIREMDLLMGWLPEACPENAGARLVHGDFRLDNCVIAPDRPAVAAVLDWELATIGDPVADFAYHLMQWHMPRSEEGTGVGSLKGHETEPGLPAYDAYIADYCRRTGRASLPQLDIYLAYNFFRLAAIFQGIIGRVRDGTAANPHAAAMADQVRPLADTAWRFAKAAGA